MGGKEEEEEEEPIFEIRDFTCASSFEDFVNRSSLALKQWAGDLIVTAKYTLHPERVDALDYEGLRCELHCDFTFPPVVPARADVAVATGASASASGVGRGVDDGGGCSLKAGTAGGTIPRNAAVFPAFGAVQLERWFGTRHTATMSFGTRHSTQGESGDNDDISFAQTLLSALVLAASSRRACLAEAVAEPLACFVVVEGGRWQRLIGERQLGSWRTLYCTDRAGFVAEEFRGGPGSILTFFRDKFSLRPAERAAIAIRDTFGAKMLRNQQGLRPTLEASGRGPGDEVRERGNEQATAVTAADWDPVEAIQLEGEGVETRPGQARLTWRLRVLGAGVTATSQAAAAAIAAAAAAAAERRLSRKLRQLLLYRAEAAKVRSVDQWFTLADPGISSSSLGNDGSSTPRPSSSLEQLARRIFKRSTSRRGSTFADTEADVLGVPAATLRSAPQGCLLSRFAEVAVGLPSLRAILEVWALVLSQLRSLFDGADFYPSGVGTTTAVGSPRPSICGARTRRLCASHCLLQQKLDLVEACHVVQTADAPLRRSALTSLTCVATSVPLISPPVLLPRLVTGDMEAEFAVTLDAMDDPNERVSFACAEFSADASAFKAANPGAELGDFLAWRLFEGIDDGCLYGGLPDNWRERAWSSAVARPAVEQTPLFNPSLEAEKALHSLESADTAEFLTQLFTVCLWTGLDAFRLPGGRRKLSEATDSREASSKAGSLQRLHTEAEEAAAALTPLASRVGGCRSAQEHSDENDEVGGVASVATTEAELVEVALAACDRLEALAELVTALRPKLGALGLPPDDGVDGPLFALAAAAAASGGIQWRELECPLPAWASIAVVALVREYIVTAVGDEGAGDRVGKDCCGEEPPPMARLYAEVGVGHVRLATAHTRPMA
eukprot:TRINITY_DN10171_c0_g2_i1.p1 TRINITY_DN10171_c0_g2~~TRINITY_DN10171_c0_g2_i1.p1  ORF type:complete len:899 (-),score=197.60 TRINITY_DN10171_c0_g2_i1:137-2833(-)